MKNEEIISEIINQLKDLKYEHGDYCIIVYRVFSAKTFSDKLFEVKEVYQVFKSLLDFTTMLDDCINSISEDYGIDIDIWKYD
jgi:hypothetical protein